MCLHFTTTSLKDQGYLKVKVTVNQGKIKTRKISYYDITTMAPSPRLADHSRLAKARERDMTSFCPGPSTGDSPCPGER